MTDELTARRHKEVLAAVARRRRAAEVAGEGLRSAIVEAVDAGATHGSVAEKAGLTRGRVSQIVAEMKAKP